MEKFKLCYSLVILFLILYPNIGCLAARELLNGRLGMGESKSRAFGSVSRHNHSWEWRRPPPTPSTSSRPMGIYGTTVKPPSNCHLYRCRTNDSGTIHIEAHKYHNNTIHRNPKD
ncbi:hypothetical protein M5689_005923 [Euphorbia peplus]|nr:hypothetical protein M5689_005923 [Euphorbia peplus]